MQTVSAYLLEKTGLAPEQLQSRIRAVHESVSNWLAKKGGTDVEAQAGSFASKTPGEEGTFTREVVIVDDDYAESVVLKERASTEQIFVTRLTLVARNGSVTFHASVSAANLGTTIVPRQTSARCPSVVRDVIKAHRDWSIGSASIPSGRPQAFDGLEGGEDVSRIILSTHRKLPIVLVSREGGEFVWDDLDKNLAFDLVGLAYVSSIDAEAGWEISNRLGKRNACFQGAIRLYWPNQSGGPNDLRSSVWTPERILDTPAETNAEERFRDELRRRVMSAAALSITEPAEAGEIFRAHARRKLAELQGSAAEVDSVYEVANSLADDLDDAKRRIAKLEIELAIASTRAENAEALLSVASSNFAAGPENESAGAPSVQDDEQADADVIESGQVVYYKKVDSKGRIDRMVRRGDCGHNRWESSHGADKARKGIEFLEGRSDWKSLYHCARCTGGGVWKVTW